MCKQCGEVIGYSFSESKEFTKAYKYCPQKKQNRKHCNGK